MSEVQPRTASFLDLYRDGCVSAQEIDDFIAAWHDADASEQRSLTDFLGMSEDEYAVWMASRQTLPVIVAARQTGRPLVELVAAYLAGLRRAAQPSDIAAIHVLSHWVEGRRHNSGGL